MLTVRSALTLDNAMNRGDWAIKQTRQSHLAPPCRMEIAHRLHVLGRKAAVMVCLAKGGLARVGVSGSSRLSALANLVAHVVGRSAKKQVGGIAASGIIAPMTHEHPRRDRAVGQLPCIPMGCDMMVASGVENPVTAERTVSAERPATVRSSRTLDLGPKPLNRVGLAPWEPRVVTVDESLRLALDVAKHCRCLCGKGGELPTATMAIPIPERPKFVAHVILLSGITWPSITQPSNTCKIGGAA